MIVDTAAYVDAQRQAAQDWSQALQARRAAGEGFVWIGLHDPTLEELTHLANELQLHPLAVEDAVRGRQRPKLEVYDSSLFLVLRPLEYVEETSQIETGELMVFVGDRFVVTVRRGRTRPLRDVRARVEAQPQLLRGGPAQVLHAVMDAVVDRYTEIDEEVARDLAAFEDEVFSGASRRDTTAIYALKREVQEMRRALEPLVRPATQLARAQLPFVPKKARAFFGDVLDHLVRTLDHVEGYDKLLTDLLNVHLTQVSVRQNEDVRKISSWAAIAAAPTLVASVYGMNFEHMPELGWHYGYAWALALILGVSGGLYAAFKRSGWL
ncbi:magnesium/cobalt transporter CorA [Quadrisphaera sp. DSM 44207]|uniref:magnesium/cobalt transporter CorA n=1 Tax=Quadrisphaera sp. DSM 44207 TaxID=1881057 RepID=UPI0008915B66|nr:magnesium/cobalt transporter CorA [Quadrisphaera sp. DSM 44207]SDQ41031.1 magnesium transporter [Quadrisphaera sp. DSM 44207]